MQVENNWPYLPQGDYTLKYSYTINREVITEDKTEMKPVHLALVPTFGVEVSANTSYSVYKSQGAAAANSKDGSGIFDIVSTVKISSAILDNEKYASLPVAITYTTDSGGSYDAESNSFKNLDWKQHKLTATATFDGGSCASQPLDYEVTGVPYNISFNGNAEPSDWILSNNGKAFGRFVLKRGDAYALSPKFHISEEFEVSVILNAYAYGGSIYSSYKPTVSIHPSETGMNSSVIVTLSGTNATNPNSECQDISTSFMLTPSVGKVCVYTKGEGSNWSTGLSNDLGVVCDHFSVEYK